MMIVTPIGYPSKTQSEVDRKLREMVHGDERLAPSKLFYENDFSTPLNYCEDCLDAIRWAPSAANRQPWRVVKKMKITISISNIRKDILQVWNGMFKRSIWE